MKTLPLNDLDEVIRSDLLLMNLRSENESPETVVVELDDNTINIRFHGDWLLLNCHLGEFAHNSNKPESWLPCNVGLPGGVKFALTAECQLLLAAELFLSSDHCAARLRKALDGFQRGWDRWRNPSLDEGMLADEERVKAVEDLQSLKSELGEAGWDCSVSSEGELSALLELGFEQHRRAQVKPVDENSFRVQCEIAHLQPELPVARIRAIDLLLLRVNHEVRSVRSLRVAGETELQYRLEVECGRDAAGVKAALEALSLAGREVISELQVLSESDALAGAYLEYGIRRATNNH